MCSCVGALEEDIHTPAHSSGQYWGDGSLRRNDKAKLVYVRTAQVTSWLTPGHTVLRGPLSLAPFGSLATNRAPPNERTGS